MSLKKTMKRNNKSKKYTKNTRKNRFRRTKKRGGTTNPFLKPTNTALPFANTVDCSHMNIDAINSMKELHGRYQKCCPRNMLGYKNSSAICKKIEKRFHDLYKIENDSHGYYGYDEKPDDTPPEKPTSYFSKLF